jgi:hypothetical protein
MDWSNEPYVRVYTRETDDDLALSWEARALWDRLLTKLDRSGYIETKRGPRGLAAVTRIPLNVVERVLPELLEDGRLVSVEGGFLAPNYIAAQEASKSDKQRQKDSRDRRRAYALDPNVTNRDGDVPNRDASVTDGHDASRPVTLCSAEHSTADPKQEPAPRAPAILPSTTQYDPESVGDRRRLAERTYVRIAIARDEVIAELGLRQQVPMPKVITPAEPIGFRDLRERILAEGALAPQTCEQVIENLVRQAREDRSVEWLSNKAFTEGGWSTARNGGPPKHRPRSGPQQRTGAIGSATPRTDHGSEMKPAKEVM